MKPRFEREGKTAIEPFVKSLGIFALVGMILFLHVWLPIQAERSLLQLRQIENHVAQKKMDLNNLNEQYAQLSSLASLDQWAKKNGPWIPAQAKNVDAIEK